MKIAFTGGGTLGHVIPALSVYDELVSRYGSFDSFYIGSKKKSEAEYVKGHGLRFYPVSTGKLRRYFSLENFTDIFRVCAGFFQSLGILRREKPDVLFSKGGFVSVPVCLAASILGIKLVTHESDCSMGLANRINSRFADIVCLGFDSTAIEGKKYIYTGNPVRHEIVSIAHEDIPVSEDLILVLGGSMGAAEINTLVYENLDALCLRWHVVHQAGTEGIHRRRASASDEEGEARHNPERSEYSERAVHPGKDKPAHSAQEQPEQGGSDRERSMA